MKKLVKIFSLCMVLAGSASAAIISDEPENEKTKSYSKTYTVGSNDKISLNNSFGDMKISTWSKNEIKVDITMSAKASTDDRAQKMLDRISIEDGKSGSDIFFKTNMGDNNKDDRDDNWKDDNDKEHNTRRLTINYTVYLPANATLDATNSFGAMSIGDFEGAATLSSKFGSLTAGKISQSKKISVQFGKATIESINNGKLSIQFSSAQVNKLSGDISVDLEQSHAVKLNLDNSLKQLDIHNSFSHVYLDADKNLSANFTVKTSMGDFSNQTAFPVTANGRENEHGYTSYSANKTYSGKSGSGNIPINIKSSFGQVTLGHDLRIDVNEKNSKHERKVRA